MIENLVIKAEKGNCCIFNHTCTVEKLSFIVDQDIKRKFSKTMKGEKETSEYDDI